MIFKRHILNYTLLQLSTLKNSEDSSKCAACLKAIIITTCLNCIPSQASSESAKPGWGSKACHARNLEVSWLPMFPLFMVLERFWKFNFRFYYFTFFCIHLTAMCSACVNPFLYGWLNENISNQVTAKTVVKYFQEKKKSFQASACWPLSKQEARTSSQTLILARNSRQSLLVTQLWVPLSSCWSRIELGALFLEPGTILHPGYHFELNRVR